MSDYLVQEDGLSRYELEDGSGFLEVGAQIVTGYLTNRPRCKTRALVSAGAVTSSPDRPLCTLATAGVTGSSPNPRSFDSTRPRGQTT